MKLIETEMSVSECVSGTCTFPKKDSVLPPLVEHHLHCILAADRVFLPFMFSNRSVREEVEPSGEVKTEGLKVSNDSKHSCEKINNRTHGQQKSMGCKQQTQVEKDDGHRCRVR